MFDEDDGGAISAEELGKAMRSLGVNPTPDEIEAMIKEVDVDNTGEIDFDEFVQLMKNEKEKALKAEEERKKKENEKNKKKKRSEMTPEERKDAEMRAIFDMFDEDHGGSISGEELGNAMR